MVGKRSWIISLALLLMVMVATTGLGMAKTVIQHYHNPAHGTAWSEWINAQIEAYEKLNPDIEIELITPSSSVGADQFLTLIASGTPIDVSELVLRIAASVAGQDAYRDLRPYFARSTKLSLDQYVPVAQKAMTRPNGQVFGVPVDLYLVPTHYQADMFSRAGLVTPAELGTDWNFDAALQAAKHMTVDKNGDGVPEEWGTQNPYNLWVYRNAFENRGAEWFDRDIQPTESHLTSNKVVEALNWVAELHTMHNVADIESSSYSGAFPKGNYGWSLGTGPNTGKILERAEANFNWGVALPVGGERQGSYTAVNSLQIPTTSQHPEEAWKWIEFLLTREDSWKLFIDKTGRMPAQQKRMPLWLDVVKNSPNPPEGADNYITAAVHPDNYLDILSPYFARFDQISRPLVQEVIRGDKDARAALEEIDQQMKAIFAEARTK